MRRTRPRCARRLVRRRRPAGHPGRHPDRAARDAHPGPAARGTRRDGHPGDHRGRQRNRHDRRGDARRRIGEVTIAAADPDQPAGTLQAPLRILWDLVTGQPRRERARGSRSAPATHSGASQDFTLAKAPVTYLERHARPVRRRLLQHRRSWPWPDGTGARCRRCTGTGPTRRSSSPTRTTTARRTCASGTARPGRRLPSGATVTAELPRRLRRRRPGRRGTVAGPHRGAQPALGAATRSRPPAAPTRDPPETLRRLAPRSVLTFGRAISGDDYAAVAAAAPGVTRAAASWAWDPAEQRPAVPRLRRRRRRRGRLGQDRVAGAGRPEPPADRGPGDPLPAVLRIALELDPAYVPAGVRPRCGPPSWTRPAGCSPPGCSAWASRCTAAGSRRSCAPSPA